MDFAPTEQPDNLPDDASTGRLAGDPAYVAAVQPVAGPARRSRSLVAGAILAGAIGVAAIAVALASTGSPAAGSPTTANAQGVLLGADTGTWTAPNGATTTAPSVTGMMGGDDGPAFGPGGGFGPGGRMGGRGILGSVSITAIDGQKLGLRTTDGWTRTIDATGATIQKGGQTVDISTLKVGDSITFDQVRQADGTFKVSAIQVVLPHADGVVKSVADSSVTITQRDGTAKVIQLTGSTTYQLGTGASTRAALVVGAEVDVQGTTTTDGTFTASLVTIHPAVAAGTVTGTTPTSITVTIRGGASLTITVDATTTYQVAGVTNPSLSDVKVGATVMADGTRKADGTFSATVVRAFAAGSGFGPGMRGGRGMPWGSGMPWGPGRPAPQASPTPTGTTN